MNVGGTFISVAAGHIKGKFKLTQLPLIMLIVCLFEGGGGGVMTAVLLQSILLQQESTTTPITSPGSLRGEFSREYFQ